MRKVILFIAILFLLSTCLFSQERGFKVVVKTNEGSPLELYKQYRALIIGVSDYLYWPRLPNAVKDAREVASVLKEIGFITKILEDPNSEEIKDALDNLVFREGEAGDGVLIYFAGHGETMKLADGTELGYIIPKDCPLRIKDPIGFTRKAMSMEDIQTYSLQLNSKHLLAVFDSCFSGSIFALGRGAPADITHKTALPVRQYITASSADEIVPDKSIFKDCFLGALKGEADLNNDGYVTGSELGMYLESNVVNYSRNAQHPQYGKIRNLKLDKGDFVFVLEKARLGVQEEIPTPPKAEKLDLASIEESAKKRGKWRNWQEQMKSEFNRVESIDQNPMNTNEEKKSAWDEFLRNYNEDNPISTEDEQLRKRATQRIKALSELDIDVRTRVSLRSLAGSLSENEVGEMLKRKNFFSKQYNYNKNFCNPRGDFANEYEVKTIRGDKVVLDHATGLMWHQSGSDKYLIYEKAKEWIDELNRMGYAGYSDWRLPTLEEGASLIERSKMNGILYIDQRFSVRQEWIWTSDIFSDSSGRVWAVSFLLGYVFRENVKYYIRYYVRPVRSGR